MFQAAFAKICVINFVGIIEAGVVERAVDTDLIRLFPSVKLRRAYPSGRHGDLPLAVVSSSMGIGCYQIFYAAPDAAEPVTVQPGIQLLLFDSTEGLPGSITCTGYWQIPAFYEPEARF